MNAFGKLGLVSTLPSALLFAGISTAGAIAAKAEPAFDDFFANGQLILDARYRYEHVEQAGFADDADAHTVRVRAGFQTGKVWDFQALIELEGIGHLSDDFNDTVNGNIAFPVVADPEDFQVNRLQLEYSGIEQTVVTIGRQRLNLDSQRFIGNSAFRQNEQTFDAARVTNTSIPNLAITYAYVNRVNRVFGQDSTQDAFEGDTHLVNAAYDIAGWGKVAGYGYFLDLEQSPALSSETFGARFAGKHDVADGLGAVYALEFATQRDNADNTGNFDLDYWLVEAGLTAYGFRLVGGLESLEGDGVRGFSTPLASLHKFQGTADVFLTTPANGIVDTYGALVYDTNLEDWGPVTGVTAAITYHDFDAERGGASFGSETDAELSVRFGEHWSAAIQYADYNGDGGFADRDKLWLSVDVTY